MSRSEGQDNEDGGLYLYCLIRNGNGHPFGRRGLSAKGIDGTGGKVCEVSFHDLGFVVSESPKSYYDPTRTSLMAHQKVIEKVMEKGFEPLPVRFSTVARRSESTVAEERVVRVLRRRFGEFQGLLGDMEDKVELGLKVFWRKERLFDEIVSENRDIRALRDGMAAVPPQGLAWRNESLRLGTMVSDAMAGKREQDARIIVSALRPIAYDYKTNKVSSDMMLLNGAFLVCKERVTEFDKAVQKLDERYGERMKLKYVGPLPPFNFIEIIIHWDEEEE
ncbi:GvpL/GvpF family gas vesicle protein [Candidatus Bathyarchaeota archaeon]|nr:GvpL/GvpF family gas vesicle protein [Candidatus Bathyarchaeota archaeon]